LEKVKLLERTKEGGKGKRLKPFCFKKRESGWNEEKTGSLDYISILDVDGEQRREEGSTEKGKENQSKGGKRGKVNGP